MSLNDDRHGSPTGPSTERRRATTWRSLEELSGSEGFRDMLHREFPRFAAEWDEGVDRRRFLQLSSAGLALAGLTACTKQPPEEIVPYVRKPEEIIPGKPLYYATSVTRGGYALPVLAESHVGRPTKLAGNAEHPAAGGSATDVFTQAEILGLYDPDRSQSILEHGRVRSWQRFAEAIGGRMIALRATGGAGLRLLTAPVSSPTLAASIGRLLAALPEARWVQWESGIGDHAAEAARTAFGRAVSVRYDLSQADVVLAVDTDFLNEGPAAVRYARDFMARRKGETLDERAIPTMRAASEMNRLYSVETCPTGTSTVADHRVALPPSGVAAFVLALAAELGVGGASAPSLGEKAQKHLDAIVEDLQSAGTRAAVIAGDHLDPEVQVLVHAINERLGAVGSTVFVSEPLLADAGEQSMTLAELAAELAAGEVDTLVVSGTNPAYDAPADLDFGTVLAGLDPQVTLTVHHGLHLDETAEQCVWHVPAAHDLESWGDGRSWDGTVTLRQPLVEPLYEGKSTLELISIFEGRMATGRELLREHHKQASGLNGSFDIAWRRLVHDGFIPDSAPASAAGTSVVGASAAASALAAKSAGSGIELAFRPDPTLYDGRYANNGWLQECPKPITMLTWDNALLVAPATAREILSSHVHDDRQDRDTQMVEVTLGERKLEAAIWVVPGHAEGCATLYLGGGRRRGGTTLAGPGFDANQLRSADALWHASGAEVRVTGEKYLLASTQDHFSMEGRDMVRSAPAETYVHELEKAGVIDGGGHIAADKLPEDVRTSKGISDLFDEGAHIDIRKTLMKHDDFPYDGYAWGMTVDLSTCTGCNACVVACVAENNIPVVGKDQVARGREMHWIRIDRYFVSPEHGDHDGQHAADDVEAIVTQPVYCMHCEQAPCEIVCPVAATVHSDEGLNDMVYNRCVGTRYCSNNCPYKVRRFNFLLYSDFKTPSLALMRNPDVTVRSRGVMEKCTYCVQRINVARQTSKVEKRKIRDGEIVTACQEACPSDCLSFGDVNDPEAVVTGMKRSPRNYSLLAELGTRPRTTYLARLTNPNPKLAPEPLILGGHGHHGGDHHGGDHGDAGGHDAGGHDAGGHAGDDSGAGEAGAADHG